MKLLIILIMACAVQCVLGQGKSYTDKYDTVNLDQVLSNKRLLHAYIKCTLDKGKCTSEGRELKFVYKGVRSNRKRFARSPTEFNAHIVEALRNGCEKCTNAQRTGMKRVIKHLMTYEKAYWTQLVDKYDPKREFSQKYENELTSL